VNTFDKMGICEENMVRNQLNSVPWKWALITLPEIVKAALIWLHAGM